MKTRELRRLARERARLIQARRERMIERRPRARTLPLQVEVS